VEDVRENPGNYRPVNQTSTLGKMIETIIKCNISRHVGKYDILRKSPCGIYRVVHHKSIL